MKLTRLYREHFFRVTGSLIGREIRKLSQLLQIMADYVATQNNSWPARHVTAAGLKLNARFRLSSKVVTGKQELFGYVCYRLKDYDHVWVDIPRQCIHQENIDTNYRQVNISIDPGSIFTT